MARRPALQVSCPVLRRLATEAAVHSLLLLLREIESRLDTFRCTASGHGARRLPAGRLRQRDPAWNLL